MPRDQLPPPRHPDGAVTISAPKQIRFWHPGYALPPATPFLVLPAFEKETLHHETARLACALASDNRTDGFLSTDIEGKDPVGADPDLQLDRAEYYFQVPEHRAEWWQEIEGSGGSHGPLSKNYPIFPEFDNYAFSHLPKYWTRASIPPSPQYDMAPSATRASCLLRDNGTCRLSNERGWVEAAHMISQTKNEWAGSRGMRRFGAVDSHENAIVLRGDLHTWFDAKHFAIVPRTRNHRGGAPQDESAVLTAHMLTKECGLAMARIYHDVPLQPLSGVMMEFVWCRFAWAVLAIVQRSIELNLRRRLLRWNTKTYKAEIEEDTYTKPKSRNPSPSKSRNSSPTKRDADGLPITRKRTLSQTSDGNDEPSPATQRSNSRDRGRRRWRHNSPHTSSTDQAGSLDGSFTRSTTDDTDLDLHRQSDHHPRKTEESAVSEQSVSVWVRQTVEG